MEEGPQEGSSRSRSEFDRGGHHAARLNVRPSAQWLAEPSLARRRSCPLSTLRWAAQGGIAAEVVLQGCLRAGTTAEPLQVCVDDKLMSLAVLFFSRYLYRRQSACCIVSGRDTNDPIAVDDDFTFFTLGAVVFTVPAILLPSAGTRFRSGRFALVRCQLHTPVSGDASVP